MSSGTKRVVVLAGRSESDASNLSAGLNMDERDMRDRMQSKGLSVEWRVQALFACANKISRSRKVGKEYFLSL